MTPAELVGMKMAEGRRLLGMTQAELGAALEPYLGKSWSNQAVSKAEQGRRDFTAEEILALVAVLDQTPNWLFDLTTPDHSEMPVEFSGQQTMAVGDLTAAGFRFDEPAKLTRLHAAAEAAGRLAGQLHLLALLEKSEKEAADEGPYNAEKDSTPPKEGDQ